MCIRDSLLYDGGKIEEMSNAVNEAFDVDQMCIRDSW